MGKSTFDVIKANAYIGPIDRASTGQVFYVNGSTVLAPGAIGGSNGNNGLSPQEPFSTIEYAVDQCTANRGDTIYVLPSHTETVAAADLNIDVAGVSVIGLGQGAARATLNLTATGSVVQLSAANCLLEHFLVTGGIDAIVSPIRVSAADCALRDIEYRDVTGQCTDGLLTTAAADRLLIDGYTHNGDTGVAGTNAAIALVGGNRITIRNLWADGDFAVGVIDVRTTATTNLEVYNVRARTRNTVDIIIIDTITGSTGNIGPNMQVRLQENAINITEAITGATWVLHGGGASGLVTGMGISVVNLAGEQGMPINTTQSTDA